MLNRFKVWMQRSGIRYVLAPSNPVNGTEMMDSLNPFRKIIENPRYPLARLYRTTTVHQGLRDTFDLLIGNHYDLHITGKGRVGILDIFLLPLISRKIIYNLTDSVKNMAINFNNGDAESSIFNDVIMALRATTWFVLAIPAVAIETARFLVAATITAFLSPIVLAVYAFTFFKSQKLFADVLDTKITLVNESDTSTNTINLTLGDWIHQNNVTDIEEIKYDAIKRQYYRKMDYKFFSRGDVPEDNVAPNFKLQPKSYRLGDNENSNSDPFEELNIGQHVRVR
jgi:hypothetical protein